MKFTSMIIAAMFAFFFSNMNNAQADRAVERNSISIEAQGGDKTSFTVYGKCGMCENRIEKTANKIEGVSNANWDKSSQKLTISYDADKVEVMKVHKALVEVGYDTEKVKAEDETYESLPGCCRYERK